MNEDFEFENVDTRSRDYIKAEIENFDENEDVILPNSIFGEIVYIFYILCDMCSERSNREKKWFLLKRQIRMFKLWRKNNYGN